MSERWIPIVAAVVGVLGGMGGAFIGGYVANEGQQQRFKEERKSQLEDLRRETYVRYLRNVDAVVELTFLEKTKPSEREIANTQFEARSARDQVLLVSSKPLRNATVRLMKSLEGDEQLSDEENFGNYEDARERFIVAAESEILRGRR